MERIQRTAARVIALIGLASVAGALLAASASADIYQVIRTDDDNGTPIDPNCAGAVCTLRQAVMVAESHSGSDEIDLAAGTYTLTIPGTGDASQGDFDINHNLDIVGQGAGNTIINANGAVTGDRAFDVHSETLTLRGVTVESGIAPNEGGIAHGGGIRNASNLYLWDSKVAGNSLPGVNGEEGGGIYNAGHAVLTRTEVTGNHADAGFGGGLYTSVSGQTELYDSKFFDNHGEFGAGLASDEAGGTVTVQGSQFSYNVAGDLGGAAYQLGSSSYSFVNTTINGNTAGAGNGGGALRVRDGTATLNNATITRNSAPNGGGISVQQDNGASASVTLANTILAGNTDSQPGDGSNPDCYDPDALVETHFHSLGHNIVGNVEGCSMQFNTGDQLGTSIAPVDPKLDPSEHFNGGPFIRVFTDALLPGSPAINKGDPGTEDGQNGHCSPVDARGVLRKTGGRCDIGAYELVKCHGTVVNRVGTSMDDLFLADSSTTSTLAPTSGDDGFLGYAGDDTLSGSTGDDALCGGGGADTLKGGKGDDVLVGGPGGDNLVGGPGHDVCIGGKGHDTARSCEVERSIP